MLDAPAFLGAYSRLLIDLNRPLDIPGSIPVRSEATIVPGNDALSREERERRRDRIFAPFQQAIAAAIDRRIDAGLPTILIAVHSFTPVFLGVARSEEHTSELQSLMRISYAVFCLKKTKTQSHIDFQLTLITMTTIK